MGRYQVKGPDGAVHVFEGPDGATPEQVVAVAQQMFGAAPAKPAEMGLIDRVLKADADMTSGFRKQVGNAAAGALRGAGSIGATLLWPVDKAQDLYYGDRDADLSGLVTGKQPVSRNEERRQAMTDVLRDRRGHELASVQGRQAGRGSRRDCRRWRAVANGARAVGASAPLVDAIASGGFSGGGNMLTRMAGGSINGAATAGLVDPHEAGAGAVIGGLLPGGVKLAGMAGNALSDAAQAGGRRLMQSAIKPTIAQLRAAMRDDGNRHPAAVRDQPEQGGREKLKGLIDDLNNQISTSIGSSTATVSKQKVLDTLKDVQGQVLQPGEPDEGLGCHQGRG
jgi:hypothetical protein